MKEIDKVKFNIDSFNNNDISDTINYDFDYVKEFKSLKKFSIFILLILFISITLLFMYTIV